MSDWSSDVCSSVLFLEGRLPVIAQWQAMGAAPAPAADERPARAGKSDADDLTAWLIGWLSDRLNLPAAAIAARDRRSVSSGRRVSGRVALGGGRHLKKTKCHTIT